MIQYNQNSYLLNEDQFRLFDRYVEIAIQTIKTYETQIIILRRFITIKPTFCQEFNQMCEFRKRISQTNGRENKDFGYLLPFSFDMLGV